MNAKNIIADTSANGRAGQTAVANNRPSLCRVVSGSRVCRSRETALDPSPAWRAAYAALRVEQRQNPGRDLTPTKPTQTIKFKKISLSSAASAKEDAPDPPEPDQNQSTEFYPAPILNILLLPREIS
jgi:hypothetical protein